MSGWMNRNVIHERNENEATHNYVAMDYKLQQNILLKKLHFDQYFSAFYPNDISKNYISYFAQVTNGPWNGFSTAILLQQMVCFENIKKLRAFLEKRIKKPDHLETAYWVHITFNCLNSFIAMTIIIP